MRMEKYLSLPPHRSTKRNILDSFINNLNQFIDWHASWLFPTPGMLVLIFLFAIPIIYTVYLSFHFWNLSPSTPPLFIGLDNYKDIFTNPRFLRAVWHTFYFSGLSLFIQIPLGLVIALILNHDFVGRGLVRTLFLFPMMATPVSTMIGWRMMLDPNSGIVGLLAQLGLPRVALLASPTWALPTFVIADTWRWTPFVALILLSGLSSLPEEPYEAAVIDGASPWQLFRHITLPLLRPTFMVAVVFRVIDSLKVFDTIYVLSGLGGGVSSFSETLNIYSYYESFEYFHTGYASALLVVFFFIVYGVSLIIARIRRSSQYD